MPEISVDEFLSKRALTTRDGVVYKAARRSKSFDKATRSATFVMTDETTDSYGDTVRAKGAVLDRFMSNPICLLNHRSDLILGGWSDIQQKPKKIEGRATLAAAGTAPHIDMAYGLLEQDILRAASIGFMPLKIERKLDDKGEPTWSYDILEWDMYECSICAVPSNPAALAKSIKDGNMLARDFLEEVLDTYERTAAGVIVPRADFEAAHKDATGNKTTISIEAPAWLAEVRTLTERMEKASATLTKAEDAVPGPTDDEADVLMKAIEESLEAAIQEHAADVAAIDEPERKSALTKILDGVRAFFKAPEPAADPAHAPVPADPELLKALAARAALIEARHRAA